MGSTPTYALTRFSVSSQSSACRPLKNLSIVPYHIERQPRALTLQRPSRSPALPEDSTCSALRPLLSCPPFPAMRPVVMLHWDLAAPILSMAFVCRSPTCVVSVCTADRHTVVAVIDVSARTSLLCSHGSRRRGTGIVDAPRLKMRSLVKARSSQTNAAFPSATPRHLTPCRDSTQLTTLHLQ